MKNSLVKQMLNPKIEKQTKDHLTEKQFTTSKYVNNTQEQVRQKNSRNEDK